MVNDCARNIHLRNRATKLLLFYAKQSNGFRPALMLIEKETGISTNKISEIRNILVDHGLINYNREQRYIYIAWNRIRAFAMLDKPLRITRGKCYFFPAIETKEYIEPDKTVGSAGREYRLINPRQLSDEEKRQFTILENMKEKEYYLMVEAIRELEFPQMPRPPDTS